MSCVCPRSMATLLAPSRRAAAATSAPPLLGSSQQPTTYLCSSLLFHRDNTATGRVGEGLGEQLGLLTAHSVRIGMTALVGFVILWTALFSAKQF
jgi:hypothetical protein